MAQLVARLVRIEEVRGSNPLRSTVSHLAHVYDAQNLAVISTPPGDVTLACAATRGNAHPNTGTLGQMATDGCG